MSWTRSLAAPSLATSSLAALCVMLAACGAAGRTPTARSHVPTTATLAGSPAPAARGPAPPHGAFRGDEDDDDTGKEPGNIGKDNDADFDNDLNNTQYKGYHDSDDHIFTAFGHSASPASRRVITTLFKRYYMAASAGDGAAACPLIHVALKEAIPEDYGQPPGPFYSRGKTCAAVMSKLFQHFHSQVAAPIEVTGVRVKGNEGYVLFGSRDIPAGDIAIKRERGIWKINGLYGGPLQ